MKKISIILVMLVILIAGILGTVPVMAAGVSASINASKNHVKKGETITVTVSFGETVSVAQFKLNFDSNIFEYKSVSIGRYSEGTKLFGHYSDSKDISKITFTFLAKEEGKKAFSISNVSVAREPGTSPIIGEITKGSTTVEVSSKEDNPTPGGDHGSTGGDEKPTNPNPNPGSSGEEKPDNQPTGSNNGSSGQNTGSSNKNNNDNKDDNKDTKPETPVEEQPEQPTEEQPPEETNSVVEENPNEENNIDNVSEGEENVTEEKKDFNIWKYVKYILIFIVIIGVIIIIIRANKETY